MAIKKFFIPAVIILFLFVSFPAMINYPPYGDVTMNYLNSYFMNFSNFIDIMHIHGHPIVWYLVMMPFAKTGIFYPYSIMILNYVCIFAALVIMLFKAPFNGIIKIAVVFSPIILDYFAILPRCYSIGILGLFILADMFKNQLKRPVLYSIIMGLTANTSAIAAIGVSAFFLLFIYNFFKNYGNMPKNRLNMGILSAFIILVSIIFLVMPHLSTGSSALGDALFIDQVKDFFYTPALTVSYIAVCLVILFNRNPNYPPKNEPEFWQSKFFLIYTFAVMWLFMYIAWRCSFYHRYFFYIYIIIAIWLQKDFKTYNNLKNIIFTIIFAVMMYFSTQIYRESDEYQQGLNELKINMLKNKTKYENSIAVFFSSAAAYTTAPYLLHRKNITMYKGIDILDYKHSNINPDKIPPERIAEIAAFYDKPLFIVFDNTACLPYINFSKKINGAERFPLYENFKNSVCIYKIK